MSYKRLIAGLAFVGLLLAPTTSFASTLTFTPATVTVKVGQTFTVGVTAIPGDAPQFTVKMDMQFTPGLLSLSTWNFYDATWAVLRQPEYDYFDNGAGSLVRTAGFQRGFSEPSKFGTATFVARSPGDATISLAAGTFILNDASDNTYNGASQVRVKILPLDEKKPESSPKATSTPVVATSTPVVTVYDFTLQAFVPESIKQKENINASIALQNSGSPITSLEVPVHIMVFDEAGNQVVDDRFGVVMSRDTIQLDHTIKTDVLSSGKYNYLVRAELSNLKAPAQFGGTFMIEDRSNIFNKLFLIIVLLLILVPLFTFFILGKHRKRRVTHHRS